EESLYILKVPIDGCEAHIRDLVQVAQALHNQFSYICSRYFTVSAVSELGFHCVHYFSELSHRDRPLLTGLEQPGKYLLAVELFPSAVLLYDHVRDLIAAFVGGKTALTAETLPAAADDFSFLALSGVNHAILLESAEGTGHKGTS